MERGDFIVQTVSQLSLITSFPSSTEVGRPRYFVSEDVLQSDIEPL